MGFSRSYLKKAIGGTSKELRLIDVRGTVSSFLKMIEVISRSFRPKVPKTIDFIKSMLKLINIQLGTVLSIICVNFQV